MKLLRTCLNIREIDDNPWLKKSFNTSRFCLSRVFLIKTDEDFRIISANLFDRIVAFCRSLFGRTYESSFAQRMHVESVKILDKKMYDAECQKANDQAQQILVPAVPPVPPVDLEAVRREARRDHLRSVLRLDQDLEKLFTDEQRACANSAIDALFQGPLSNRAVAFEVNLPAEARAELMDYLVRKDIIAAWAPGGGNRTMLKGQPGDAVKARDLQLPWRNKQTLESEKQFQERNRIGFFHQEQFNALQQAQLSRDELLLLTRTIHRLNQRGRNGPHELSETQGMQRCLNFLKNQQMIHEFRQDQGKWIVTVSQKDDGQNQPVLDVPPGFLAKQKDATIQVLNRLSVNTQQNYPRVYGIGLNQLTEDMIKEVMDHLLLQGQIKGWFGQNLGVDVTACAEDLQNLPPARGRWRTREDAQRDRERLANRPIQFNSKHFDALERSSLSGNELMALAQVVNHLNSRQNYNYLTSQYEYTCSTQLANAGLRFLIEQHLIHGYGEAVQRDPQGQIISYTYSVSV